MVRTEEDGSGPLCECGIHDVNTGIGLEPEPQIRRDLDIGDKVRRAAAIPLPAAVYTIRAIKECEGDELYLVSRNYDGKDVDRLFHRHELVLFRRAPVRIG